MRKKQSTMKINGQLPRTITREWLDRHDACKSQAEIFELVWPNGVVITRKALTSTAKSGLNLGWFARQVLSRAAYADYRAEHDALGIDYLAHRALLGAPYKAKRDMLYVEYQTKRVLLDTEHQAKLITLHGDFNARRVQHVEHETKRALLYAAHRAKRAPLDEVYEREYNTLETDYLAKCDTLLIVALWDVYKKKAKYHEE